MPILSSANVHQPLQFCCPVQFPHYRTIIHCIYLFYNIQSHIMRIITILPYYPRCCLSSTLSLSLSIYLSLYLSIYLSIHPSIYLSIYLSIHLNTVYNNIYIYKYVYIYISTSIYIHRYIDT